MRRCEDRVWAASIQGVNVAGIDQDELAVRKLRLAIEHAAANELSLAVIGKRHIELGGHEVLASVAQFVRAADEFYRDDLGTFGEQKEKFSVGRFGCNFRKLDRAKS